MLSADRLQFGLMAGFFLAFIRHAVRCSSELYPQGCILSAISSRMYPQGCILRSVPLELCPPVCIMSFYPQGCILKNVSSGLYPKVCILKVVSSELYPQVCILSAIYSRPYPHLCILRAVYSSLYPKVCILMSVSSGLYCSTFSSTIFAILLIILPASCLPTTSVSSVAPVTRSTASSCNPALTVREWCLDNGVNFDVNISFTRTTNCIAFRYKLGLIYVASCTCVRDLGVGTVRLEAYFHTRVDHITTQTFTTPHHILFFFL